MAKPRRKFLRRDELLRALIVTRVPVKLLLATGSIHIPVTQAVQIAKKGVYEGKYHNGRVYFIREVVTQKALVWDPHYRDGRCMIQPMQLDKHVTEIWDRYFTSHPTPVPIPVP